RIGRKSSVAKCNDGSYGRGRSKPSCKVGQRCLSAPSASKSLLNLVPGALRQRCPTKARRVDVFGLCRAGHSLLLCRMRILSGIQPSGALHLGNYFGMMKPAIELQEKGEAFYFIANYHSMTSLFDPAERRRNTLDVALDFLACGLDPKRTVF